MYDASIEHGHNENGSVSQIVYIGNIMTVESDVTILSRHCCTKENLIGEVIVHLVRILKVRGKTP